MVGFYFLSRTSGFEGLGIRCFQYPGVQCVHGLRGGFSLNSCFGFACGLFVAHKDFRAYGFRVWVSTLVGLGFVLRYSRLL